MVVRPNFWCAPLLFDDLGFSGTLQLGVPRSMILQPSSTWKIRSLLITMGIDNPLVCIPTLFIYWCVLAYIMSFIFLSDCLRQHILVLAQVKAPLTWSTHFWTGHRCSQTVCKFLYSVKSLEFHFNNFHVVWIVLNKQLLGWVQNPVPISNLNSVDSLKCSTPQVDSSLQICNGIPQNENGLLSHCTFSDFPFYTCVSDFGSTTLWYPCPTTQFFSVWMSIY